MRREKSTCISETKSEMCVNTRVFTHAEEHYYLYIIVYLQAIFTLKSSVLLNSNFL